jgi:hypothetical protein
MSDPQTTAKAALEWVYQEIVALCEHTEDDTALNQIARADTETKQGAFARGRIHEAKGIRRAMAEVIRVKMQEVS